MRLFKFVFRHLYLCEPNNLFYAFALNASTLSFFVYLVFVKTLKFNAIMNYKGLSYLWVKIGSLGVHQDLSLYKKKQVQLINRVCLTLIVLLIPSLIKAFILRDTFGISILPFFYICMIMTLYLNYKGKQLFSKIFFLFSLTVISCGISYILGEGFVIESCYISIAILTLIFFDKKRMQFLVLTFTLGAYLLSLYFYNNISSPLAYKPFLEMTSSMSHFTNALLVYFSITMSTKANFDYANQTSQLLSQIQSKRDKLESQKIRITKQNNTLEKTNRKLKHANKDLENFAYVASHDLKSPLRITNSFLLLIQQSLNTNSKEKLNEYLGYCIDNTKHMGAVIDSLLSHARLNNELELKPVDLEKVYYKTKNILARTIDDNNVNLKADELPIIDGYESEFILLFQNLIENGIKYNKSETKELNIKLVNNDETKITLCFQDNGLGVAPENQEKIFKMFNRLHNQKEFEGTGIGLASCQKIVSLISGKIWVESELNEGSSFFVQIPKTQEIS